MFARDDSNQPDSVQRFCLNTEIKPLVVFECKIMLMSKLVQSERRERKDEGEGIIMLLRYNLWKEKQTNDLQFFPVTTNNRQEETVIV